MSELSGCSSIQDPESYLSDVVDDLSLLGFDRYCDDINTIPRLCHALEPWSNLICQDSSVFKDLKTDAGKIIAGWGPTDMEPYSKAYFACSEAEYRFVANLNSAHDEYYRSPVIIVDDEGLPIAVAKPYGEPTVLGLSADPFFGFNEMAIGYCLPITTDIKALKKKEGAYVLSASDIEGKTKFITIRASTFTIDDQVREMLSCSQPNRTSIVKKNCVERYKIPLGITATSLVQVCTKLVNDDTASKLRFDKKTGELIPDQHKKAIIIS